MGVSRRAHETYDMQVSCRALVLSLNPDSGGFEELAASRADAIDWSWVLRRARAHKVGALLAARMEQSGLLEGLDADLRAQFRDVRRDAQAQAAAAQWTLQSLAQAFTEARIPFFVVKGSVLARHVYRDPSLRRFVDVDLVTRRDSVPRAEAVLRSLGYTFGQIDVLLAASPHGVDEQQAAEALTRRFYERLHGELPFYPPRGGELLPVDLHWHVAPRFRLNADAEQLWQQTVAVDVGGVSVTTFNPAATLVHAAVHASTCTLSAFRLLHFCDVVWAATRWCEHAGAFWQLAEEWGVSVHAGEVLETVERALSLAEPLLDRRRHASWRSYPRQWLTERLLIESGRDTSSSLPRRVWGEAVWNLAMSCLVWNVRRSLRTRIARLRWTLRRRRIERQA